MLKLLKQYFPIRNVLFFVLEGLVIFLTFLALTVFLTVSPSYLFDVILVLKIIFATIVCIICLYYNDLYDFQLVKTLPEMSIRLLQSLGIASIILAIIYYAFPMAIIDEYVYVSSVLVLIVFITGWRFFYLGLLTSGIFNEDIIIVGSSNLAFDIYQNITETIDCGYSIKAVFPDAGDNNTEKFGEDITFYYNINNLYNTATSGKIKKIVVAMKEQRGSFPLRELVQCRSVGLEIINGFSFYEQLTGKILVDKINPSWLIFSEGFKKSITRKFLKRLTDIFGSVVMLILLSPLMVLIAILIKIDSKGPIIFSQDRVGKNKKEFMMHKFRSMVNDAEKNTGPVWAGEDDPRITKMGKFIRKFRIDELPQLWNVLKGEMSLVGPRPERKHFTDSLEKDIPFYAQRFLVKPGLTGWAQISFDYAATVEDSMEKLNYELFYIKNMTTTLDLFILIRTVKIVLFGRGSR
ncbi:MAG: TIGR03013 family PEP-CTERM/XrtA system glycosyltransferase [Desulforegulaceae bacterium]|nr:TIGR03013 family PEP-CTERM/XrtA system glycosyltransferase [Desulforegulaceae bacterium]